MIIEWHSDQAASGPRERAWIQAPIGELVVYSNGDWYVYLMVGYRPQAHGTEAGIPAAKARAIHVFEALTQTTMISVARPTEPGWWIARPRLDHVMGGPRIELFQMHEGVLRWISHDTSGRRFIGLPATDLPAGCWAGPIILPADFDCYVHY